MANAMAWLGVGILAFGCNQGGSADVSPPTAVVAAAAPAALEDTAGAPVAEPKRDCDCHGKHEADARLESVDVSRIDLARAPTKGPSSARVTMLVFCDFECPYCRRADGTVAELERTYGDELRIVWKQLPLPMHENARLYAKASLAAQDQGQFWPMHDLLLHAVPHERADLDALAGSLGLDLRRFRAALDGSEIERRVQSDLDEAASVGANGTPTFVINGKKLVGAQPLATFTRAIDDALGTPL